MLLNTIHKVLLFPHIVLPYQYFNFFPFHLPSSLANTDISSRFERTTTIIQGAALQTDDTMFM